MTTTDEMVQVCEERDAYGDTLANIAASEDHRDAPAAIIAQLTLRDRGYLPWGRLRMAEKTARDATAERDQARRFAVQFEAENAHMRAVIGEISALVTGMRMPCWCITYKHAAVDALVCEACRLRGLLTDLTEMP